MSLATAISPHIPHLRRFARALTGSQQSGDRYVEAAMQALVADPTAFPSDGDTRAGLFKVFLKIWNSFEVNSQTPGGEPDSGLPSADRRLTMLSPKSRQAFLLTHVEEFAPAVAAEALEVDIAEFEQLLLQARREIAALVATDLLIIEDEPLIAIDIEEIAASLGHRCLGIARTKNEAVALCADRKPGLVLADIQLADGSSGVDAVNEILGHFDVPVIFITAYPERLLTGERPEPTFLVTKPYQPEQIKALISQALFFEQSSHLAAGRIAQNQQQSPRAGMSPGA